MKTAEFDKFADEYRATLASRIGASGETPEYFHAYKVAVAREYASKAGREPNTILDFGAGAGNSVPHFAGLFPRSRLVCADVSQKSLDIARQRFPADSEYALIEGQTLPAETASVDLVFAACVFHHIESAEHAHWLSEMRRVTRPGGRLMIFEHNPLNPLTLQVVNNCPFDENAQLILASTMRRRVQAAGWGDVEVRFHIFFPRLLAALRPWESALAAVPFGAQYSVSANNP